MNGMWKVLAELPIPRRATLILEPTMVKSRAERGIEHSQAACSHL